MGVTGGSVKANVRRSGVAQFDRVRFFGPFVTYPVGYRRCVRNGASPPLKAPIDPDRKRVRAPGLRG